MFYQRHKHTEGISESMDTLIDATIFEPAKSRSIYLGRNGSPVHICLLCTRFNYIHVRATVFQKLLAKLFAHEYVNKYEFSIGNFFSSV